MNANATTAKVMPENKDAKKAAANSDVPDVPVVNLFTVLSSLAELKPRRQPALASIPTMVPDVAAAVTRMIEISSILKASDSPSEIVASAREMAEKNSDLAEMVKKFDELSKQLAAVTEAITAIVAPPMSEDEKEKLKGEFASKKNDVLAFIGILPIMMKVAPNKTVAEAHEYLSNNLPTLKGSSTTKIGASDKLSGSVREWVRIQAAARNKVADFQFGMDDKGKHGIIAEDGTFIALSARGRIGDTFYRAYRAGHSVTLNA